MSNVEQGIMNVELRMALLDDFGVNNAYKSNLNRFSFLQYSAFSIRHSTLIQYVQWLNCMIFMVSIFFYYTHQGYRISWLLTKFSIVEMYQEIIFFETAVILL